MHVVLDTNVLLWAVGGSSNFDAELQERLRRRYNEILFSSVSIWEIAIKMALGRSDFGVDAEDFFLEAARVGFTERPVRANVAVMAAKLPSTIATHSIASSSRKRCLSRLTSTRLTPC